MEAAKAAIENNRRQRELQDSKIERALAGIDQAKAQITAAEAGIAAVQADVVRTQQERTRQEGLFQTRSTTQQRVEQAVADEQRFAAQSASCDDLQQAKTMLRSNELAAEAERRTKTVLESQDLQLIADLHAKEAALTVARVNLGYTTIEAPSDGSVGQQAMVGNSHAMGVAPEIAQHLHRAAKCWLGVDDPVLAVQTTKELRELLGIGQCGGRTGTIEFLTAIEAF